MRKTYSAKNFLLISVSFLLLAIASCKKDNNGNKNVNIIPPATPTTLGLYGLDSSIYKLLLVAVSKIGTQPVNYGLVFDTGSGGMVLDANGILPASMITSSGLSFTGDSTVVNGVTVTNQTSIVEYGDDSASVSKVYGNQAFADVTVGDNNGNVVIKRLAFLIYYKAVDAGGTAYPAHDFDTFGVNEEYDVTFPNGDFITSPFSYFDPGSGLTRGFKMAQLNADNFSFNASYIPGAITLGLTSADLSSSSGFTTTQLPFFAGEGYAPINQATITYGGNSFTTFLLFDTGTDPYSYIEDPTFKGTLKLLAANTPISADLNFGFTYNYTTTTIDNLTYVENPTATGANISIMGLEAFLNIEYMIDFTDHQLGLKNN
jgi:hypothetical protein